MDNLQFYDYVLSLLSEAGHVITSSPVYANHSASETLYIDSANDVTVSRFDRELLMLIDNVSLLTDIRWDGIVDELDENVQIFSITVNFPKRVRSQNIAHIHHLLQRYWSCSHSIVFFKNQESLVVSFADRDRSHILSDWWDIKKDFYDICERIHIGNMSLESSDDYFLDFLYACARDYYIYPVSFEEASYGLMPIDYISNSLTSDIPISKVEIKEIIKHNLVFFEERYGDDYVDPVYTGMEDLVKYHSISDEIDRISFELELDDDSDDHFETFDFEGYDDTLDEGDEFDDDYDEEDIDPAIFDDPVLMVKWLEKQQKERDDSFEDSHRDYREHQNQVRSSTAHRDQEHLKLLGLDSKLPETDYIESDHLKVESSHQECLNTEHGQVDQPIQTDTLTSLQNNAVQLRTEAERKQLDANNKRRKAEQLRHTYNELLLCESERKKAVHTAFEATEAAKQKANQLQAVADSKRLIANSKRDDAESKRQVADRLAGKYGELTRQEADRRARVEAERKAREEAERKAREEAERKARELDRLASEYTTQTSAIREKYGVQLEAAKEKRNLNANRITDIDQRVARLNILQFIEKRNLRNEKAELEKQQQELALLISQVEQELSACLEQEKKKFLDATSLI